MLIYPLFLSDRPDEDTPLPSLPGHRRRGIHHLVSHLEPLVKKGLTSVILFGVLLSPDLKDHRGSAADDPHGPVLTAIRLLRERLPELYVVADVCVCELHLARPLRHSSGGRQPAQCSGL